MDLLEVKVVLQDIQEQEVHNLREDLDSTEGDQEDLELEEIRLVLEEEQEAVDGLVDVDLVIKVAHMFQQQEVVALVTSEE